MVSAGDSAMGWANGFSLRHGDLFFGQGHGWPLTLVALPW